MNTFRNFNSKKLILGLLFVALMGTAVAQSDTPHVICIKHGSVVHYLAHVYNSTSGEYELQDATELSPDCIWYTGREFNLAGTNHNYYFFDGVNERFLAAPLTPNGSLYLSDELPMTYLLNNSEENYYFYDWDHIGLARGIKRNVATKSACDACGASWDEDGGECWEVYWIECNASGNWSMSTNSSYDITTNGVRAYAVTITEHEEVVSSVTSGTLSTTPAWDDFEMVWSASPLSQRAFSVSAGNYSYSYIPAYTEYVVAWQEETTPDNWTTVPETHYYYNDAEQTSAPSTPTEGSSLTPSTYVWTVTGDAAQYLSFSSSDDVKTLLSASSTLYYLNENAVDTKTAELTLTVTYTDPANASHHPTQKLTATVTVKPECKHPGKAAEAVITRTDVTVSWYNTSTKYKVEWKKSSEAWSAASSSEVDGATSYTFTDLEFETAYDYRVYAYCGGAYSNDPAPTAYTFTTHDEPGLLVGGAVFGGGRMANVSGNTRVVIINCDSIGAVYGGNDIAGSVIGDDGSTIVLGVKTGDADDSYGTTAADGVTIGSVYGGGNGYYLYGGATEFTGATSSSFAAGDVKYVDVAGNPTVVEGLAAGTIPSISKTSITVAATAAGDIKVDSLFGGAKNAFVTNNSGDNTYITIKNGIIYAVFGGNNYGGTLGTGSNQHIIVTNTKVETDAAKWANTATSGLGRDFGIRYLFGGGNAVQGRTAIVKVEGGQIDTLFCGGNAASVEAVNCTIDCALGALSNGAYGKVYTNALSSYASPLAEANISTSYTWDGTGIYNVRTLFGGNNQAAMNIAPLVTLTSGAVGTVYGGGNAGDMTANTAEVPAMPIATEFGSPFDADGDEPIYYGTHVVVNSANMLIDYLYGGCQLSNVDYSTWVEVENGHIGTVFGGCNISGDVGSVPRIAYSSCRDGKDYQLVKGATYVKASGGIIYKNLFAGSNGYYHCNDGIYYIDGILNLGNYIGKEIPTHNETHVNVKGTVKVKGNVYAGGNLAPVGFIKETDHSYKYRDFVGYAAIRMSAGTVEGSVYGGGNMASIYGSNEVQVSGGTIGGALYGGNDQSGLVAQITNRVLPPSFSIASDAHTSLTDLNVHTYVGITGKPQITTVYGGGNGDYTYTEENYCNPHDQPVQSNTFVDIHLDAEGGDGVGGHIGTVYGGGNGVTVTGGITVLLNVENAGENTYDHVGTIFGGNNLGALSLVPSIIMENGRVGTVYGGCNQGAMVGSTNFTVGTDSYTNVGSLVRLYNIYEASDGTEISCSNVKIDDAVYGGCRMNNVNNKSLVLVEGGTHTNAKIFGGCDISGNATTSHVVVNGGTVGTVYGGGNGDYDYSVAPYSGKSAPTSGTSIVDMLSGTASYIYGGNNAKGAITGDVTVNVLGGTVGTSGATTDGIFGGGFGENTSTGANVAVNIGAADGASGPTVYCDIYGGSAKGTVNASTSNTTTVNVNGGTINGNVYGGGLGVASLDANGYRDESAPMTEAYVNGNVQVNVGKDITGNGPTFGATSNVFGCNNLAGTPKGSVNVDVYKTAHTTTPVNNTYPTCATEPCTITALPAQAAYAIAAVYGGGNLSPYEPTTPTTTQAPVVHIHNCDNTIQYVYGGGNAAAVPATSIIIDGGRFGDVFGGGNGAGTGNPGANVNGNVAILINGGIIGRLFGGSNTKGLISGTTSIDYAAEDAVACTRFIDQTFGGGNMAPSGSITMTIPCGAKGAKQYFGGANNADVGTSATFGTAEQKNVTLNVYGGEFEDLFGGNNQGGTIWGNVTLNIYGGKIQNAFGGNNLGGVIAGNIIVNVIMDTAVCPSQMQLVNVYGGGKDANYGCSTTAGDCETGETARTHTGYPQVNIIRGCVDQNVFGGGLGATATVYGTPKVTVGGSATVVPAYAVKVEETTTTYLPSEVPNPLPTGAIVTPSTKSIEATYYWPKVGKGTDGAPEGAVYGGGSEAKVEGKTDVKIIRKAVINGNVYGGGLGSTAIVTGSTNVQIGD